MGVRQGVNGNEKAWVPGGVKWAALSSKGNSEIFKHCLVQLASPGDRPFRRPGRSGLQRTSREPLSTRPLQYRSVFLHDLASSHVVLFPRVAGGKGILHHGLQPVDSRCKSGLRRNPGLEFFPQGLQLPGLIIRQQPENPLRCLPFRLLFSRPAASS